MSVYRIAIGGLGIAISLFTPIDRANAQQAKFERQFVPNLPQIVIPRLQDTIRNLNVSDTEKLALLAAVRVDPRIVGGTLAHFADNPWQVGLIRANAQEPQRSQFCGGAIIAARWVITAAHCIDNFTVNQLPQRIHVLTGTDKISTGGNRAKVAKLFIHPNWNSDTMDNDVALLLLSDPIASGNAIPLVSTGLSFGNGANVTVTGWGAIFEGGPGSDTLLGANVAVVSNQVCNEPQSYNGRVLASMFCAGKADGGVDSCQGDSGGPVWQPINGNPVLVGVVSWGDGCARRLKYGIYTRLSNLTTWVVEVMDKNK